MLRTAIALLLIGLTGCGTFNYTPGEYEIVPGRVNPLDVSGAVTIENVQTDSASRAFFKDPHGSKDNGIGNLKEVTEHLVMQMRKEVMKSGRMMPSARTKTLRVSVVHLESTMRDFHLVSEIDVSVTMDDGSQIGKHISQGSPGNMWRVLNGVIALAVIDILNDEQVRGYLSGS
jgi:hypothetical protein